MKENTESESKPNEVEIKFGPDGWKKLEGSSDDVRKSLIQRLSQRVMDQNIVCLIGSGVSIGAGGPSMNDFWEIAESYSNIEYAKQISRYNEDGNIEALLSRCQMVEQCNGKDEEITKFIEEVQKSITQKCREFLKPTTDLHSHCSFLQRLARRSSDSSRMMVFTTNYDLCIEQAAAKVGLPVIDGFSHTVPQRFDGRNYDLDYVRRVPNQREPSFVEGAFHLYKLHGSVDWTYSDGEIIRNPHAEKSVMIFPRDSKYQLTYQQPFLEMMARFQFALRQPNTTLFVLGFGFNDDHLSAPILEALRSNPQFNLIVVARSLRKNSGDAEDAEANRFLKVFSKLAEEDGIESVTLIDSTFDQFVPLVPAVGTQTGEQRLAEIIREILQSKTNL